MPGVEVEVAAAEALPYRDGSFDAVLSQLVVNFMSDAEPGVREMARVARSGGTVVSCVWDYDGEMTLLRAFWDAAREIEPERGPGADEGVVMRWCRDGELAELWRAAGLRDVRFAPLVVSASYASFEGPRLRQSSRGRGRARACAWCFRARGSVLSGRSRGGGCACRDARAGPVVRRRRLAPRDADATPC